MKKFVCVLGIVGLSACSSAQAFVVFDPVNYGQNAISAAEAIKITKNTFDSLNELKDTYKKVKENYTLTLENLEDLKNIDQLLHEVDSSVDTYSGSSPLAMLETLDPKNADYTQKRDEILQTYYQTPIKPEDVQARLQGAVNQSQIESLKDETKKQSLARQNINDAVDESAHENAMAKERAKHIKEYNNTIKNLGDKSELKTQQTIAAEINFQAEQNEQIIQQQNETLKYLRMQQADAESEKALESKIQVETLQKAISQGNSGLGRDKWGKL